MHTTPKLPSLAVCCHCKKPLMDNKAVKSLKLVQIRFNWAVIHLRILEKKAAEGSGLIPVHEISKLLKDLAAKDF